MDPDVEVLQGGIGNAGAVVRIGPHVLRPTSPHTPAIHALLTHLHDAGFDAVPTVVAIEQDGRERLVFIPGQVPVPPFPAWSQTDAVLASTAALLRHYHDAAAGFVAPAGSTWSEEMVDPSPGSDAVVCHNDVCPENVVFRAGEAIALLDFEFAAPGRRVWDVAAMASMCVPLVDDAGAALTGRAGLDPFGRLRVVADAYGLDGTQRAELLTVLDDRVAHGGEFVRRRVDAGEPAFIEMWNAMGGQAHYDRRRSWFNANRAHFERVLSAPL